MSVYNPKPVRPLADKLAEAVQRFCGAACSAPFEPERGDP